MGAASRSDWEISSRFVPALSRACTEETVVMVPVLGSQGAGKEPGQL
jgi:hypothetical protein